LAYFAFVKNDISSFVASINVATFLIVEDKSVFEPLSNSASVIFKTFFRVSSFDVFLKNFSFIIF
jgi:hypothetical protein